jgi:hypothetical protein
MLTTSKIDIKTHKLPCIEAVDDPVFRKELGGSSPPLVAFY